MKSSIADRFKSKVEADVKKPASTGDKPDGNKSGSGGSLAGNKAGPSDKPSTGFKSVEDILKEAKAKSDVEKGAKA